MSSPGLEKATYPSVFTFRLFACPWSCAAFVDLKPGQDSTEPRTDLRSHKKWPDLSMGIGWYIFCLHFEKYPRKKSLPLFESFTMCNWLLWKYTGERGQPHKNRQVWLKCHQKPISKTVETFFYTQVAASTFLSSFYLLDWKKSLWASCVFSVSQTKLRRYPIHSTEQRGLWSFLCGPILSASVLIPLLWYTN